ncbi:hypothetical protein [Kocuria sp. HSID16901]|uniref:hypothetical protein n=1 Tax=Kocuria sp. HSID16901 TaxID=2419505 RepID=UPI000AABC4C6|nr:hypothetical protein [Kocuria sp. HSID16901]MCT1367206.1 hypothetical protein [Rothia sp. p3-SID1597]
MSYVDSIYEFVNADDSCNGCGNQPGACVCPVLFGIDDDMVADIHWKRRGEE